MRRVFSEYVTPLMAVTLFKYLGGTLLSSDNDWTAVEQNLESAQVKVGTTGEDFGKGDIGYKNGGKVLCGSGASGNYI